MRTATRFALLLVVLMPAAAAAHHGSAISYDTTNLWTTWATVKEFKYQNPHPTMTFDRTTKDGTVEAWVSELLTNPAVLARAGWTRGRSNDALKPGTRVRLYLGTARAGGHSAIIMKIENEQGESVVGDRAGVKAVADLDGVPDGLQPKEKKPLPGQPTGGQ